MPAWATVGVHVVLVLVPAGGGLVGPAAACTAHHIVQEAAGHGMGGAFTCSCYGQLQRWRKAIVCVLLHKALVHSVGWAVVHFACVFCGLAWEASKDAALLAA